MEKVAAGIGYLGLLKREFQKVQQEDKTGKTTTASSDSSTESRQGRGNGKLLLHATAGRCCNGKLDRRALGATGFCNGVATGSFLGRVFCTILWKGR